MNYTTLDAIAYADLVIWLISSAEGHESSARDTSDGQITIGYGYTFGRNTNVALWQAAGINLTASELATLQAIDIAPASQRNAIALQQFTRSITRAEAIALLRQTIPGYEGPANQLGMPLSAERAAFVSLSYNRRIAGLERRMQGFFDAVRAGDRAEAWFQFRYMSWGTAAQFEAGLRARRLVEADVFGLYDSTPSLPDESKSVYRMFNLHRQEILRLESLWGVNPDGTAGTRNLIAEVNADSRWSGFQVNTIVEALTAARVALVTNLNGEYSGLSSTHINTIAATNIYLDPGRDSASLTVSANHNAALNSTRRDAQGNEIASDDLLIGDGGPDTLIAAQGNDILIGGTGDDRLEGGVGNDVYVFRADNGGISLEGDGEDVIRDSDGIGSIRVGGVLLSGLDARSFIHPVFGDRAAWRWTIDGKSFDFILINGDLTNGGTLWIEGDGVGLGSRVTEENFHQGDLGLWLPVNPQLQLVPDYPGIGGPFADANYQPSTLSTTLQEGHARTVTLALSLPAEAGQTVRIAVSDLAEHLRIVDGANELSFNGQGFIDLTLSAGQTLLTVALLSRGDVDVDDALLTLSARLIDANGNPQGVATNLNINFDVATEGAATRTILGDLMVLDTDADEPGTQPAFDDLNNRITIGNPLPIQDRLLGSAGNDTIIGGAQGDILRGNGGDDLIFANAQVDVQTAIADGAVGSGTPGLLSMSGANGNDVLSGNAGNDTLIGSADADVLTGGAGDDLIVAGQGDDYLSGDGEFNVTTSDWAFNWTFTQVVQSGGYIFNFTGDGAQFIDNPGGADVLHAGGGDDYVIGGFGDDMIYGEDGDDLLLGTGGADTILGGNGNDVVRGDQISLTGNAANDGADFIDGGDGNDELSGEGGADVIFGGAGDDWLIGDQLSRVLDPTQQYSGDDYLNGEDGNDTLVGDGGADTLIGGAGNDTLQGDYGDTPADKQGNDSLNGGAGSDILWGQGGADVLIGGDGDDQLIGDSASTPESVHGNDYLDGGAGIDVLIGGGGADILFGGAGDDQMMGDGTNMPDAVLGDDHMDGGPGDDTLFGGGGADTLYGGEGNDYLQGDSSDTPVALQQNDYLDGGEGNDTLRGDGGNDTLIGGAGDDVLVGGDGDDYLQGGACLDNLLGEAGNDTYVFDAGDLSIVGSTADSIQDSLGVNRVVFRDWAFDAAISVTAGTGGDIVIRRGADEALVVRDALFGAQILYQFADGQELQAHELIGRTLQTALNISSAQDNAYLVAGSQNDTLTATGQSATLSGGQGNDNLIGGATKRTTYVLEAGDGADFITDTGGQIVGGVLQTNTIAFGAGITLDDLKLEYDDLTNTFRIYYNEGTDFVRVSRFDPANVLNGNRTIDEVRFSNGETITWAQLVSDLGIDIRPEGFVEGTSANDRVVGTLHDDTLSGAGGDDVLDGGAGNDVLSGGEGSDTYRFGRGYGVETINETGTAVAVDRLEFTEGVSSDAVKFYRYGDSLMARINGSADRISIQNFFTTNTVEEIRFGDGTVYTSANLILSNPAEQASVNDDEIFGSPAGDVIDGLSGADSIYGGAGNDLLQGSEGADFLQGDSGDDVLEGAAGDDSLLGGEGQDTLRGDAGSDLLLGGAGDDDLDGGHASDILRGESGNDTYRLSPDSGYDEVIETDGVDRVVLATGVLPAEVTLIRTSTRPYVDSTASTSQDSLAIVLNSGAQLLIVGYFENPNSAIEQIRFSDGTVWDAVEIAARLVNQAGTSNSQTGTIGDDIFVVDHPNDQISDTLGGVDYVSSSVSYILPSEIENLTLTGTLALRGEGNALANTIVGNVADNVLDGWGGADTLIGGLGNDIYYIDGPPFEYSHDVVIEDLEGGYDTIVGVGTWSVALPANVEAFILSNNQIAGDWSDRQFIGNELDNLIDVSAGPDASLRMILDGGGGADTLIGRRGVQVYVVDSLDDVIIELEGEDDWVSTPLSYVLPTAIQNLVLTGSSSISGTGNERDNRLDGSQNSAGNTLIGGNGDDVYVLGANDTIVETVAEGIDTAEIAFSYTLPSYVENLAFVGEGTATTTGTGNALNNRLNGQSNEATNILIGGLGDDTYFLDGNDIAVEYANEGIDTVVTWREYALDEHIENATVSYGWGTLTGNALDNVLTANVSGGGSLYGNGGNDVLVAPVSGGTYRGGRGADTYRFSGRWWGGISIQDTNTGESPDSAVDVVEFVDYQGWEGDLSFEELAPTISSVVFARAANQTDLQMYVRGYEGTGPTFVNFLAPGAEQDRIEWFRFADGTELSADQVIATFTITGTTGNDVLNASATGSDLYGFAGADILNGATGNDVLDGGDGADTMTGGAGNDLYRIDQAGDVVIEGTGSGSDTIESAINYQLANNFENLRLLGTADLNGTGNSAGNALWGNSGSNELSGGDGADSIDGGAGADTLIGGNGDDRYFVDASSDVVVEFLGEGLDTIESSVSYVAPEHVEDLTLVGAAIQGTGNALSNTIRGNALNNILDGGAGADVMYGGAGDDGYWTDTADDAVVEDAGQGTDTVNSAISWTLGANFENLTLTGSADIDGSGNALANQITGNSGNNMLAGGAGNDTLDGAGGNDAMSGGQGNDTYIVDSSFDSVNESSGQGTDTVWSYIDWTLGNNVENLTLVGASNTTALGNTSANVLTGNSGNNTLNGGSGSDTMIGGQGNDTYVVAQTGDVVTENANEGTDLVQSSITYVLGNDVENLTLTGSSAINGTGNALSNALIGNSGNNILTAYAGNDTLDGGTGTDTMVGGQGDDIYYVNVSGDVTTENANEGIDLVNSLVTRTLAANIELLFLTGTSAINGTGNSLSNLLRGNTANNTLAGGAGIDILEGGDGNDTLSNTTNKTLLNGGAGTDTLAGTATNDLLVGGTGNDALTTGAGADIIVFNKGDGQDTVAASTTRDNTLSIGGGAVYVDLLFQKSGNDLVLKVGTTDKITFTGYYASSSNRSVNNLQVVIEGTSDYDAGTADAIRNKKIEMFNFEGLVTAFDAARVANPGLTSWALTNALLAQHLSGSDTAAVGGDLSYRYNRFGTLSDISFTPALGILGASTFGTNAQTLQSPASLQDSSARLN